MPKTKKAAFPIYRRNVAGIVQNSEGRILICERFGSPGAWQFPQGGVDKGESHEEALIRELGEEISLACADYRVITCKGPYRYLFGNGRQRKGFDGQEQDYFLVGLIASEQRINVITPHQEFQAVRWIMPHEFDLAWLPEFKREVYRAVLRDFFGVLRD